MQALVDPLTVGVLSHAEGRVGVHAASQRRKLARRITAGYASGLDEISEFVGHIADEVGGTPISYAFDPGSATHLVGRLESFSTALTLYDTGRLDPSQIVEECHTILELLMRDVLRQEPRGHSFEWMARRVAELGLIGGTLVDDLIRLKNLRRGAKHKAQGLSKQSFDGVLPTALQACHELCRVVRNSGSAHPGPATNP